MVNFGIYLDTINREAWTLLLMLLIFDFYLHWFPFVNIVCKLLHICIHRMSINNYKTIQLLLFQDFCVFQVSVGTPKRSVISVGKFSHVVIN